MSDDGGAPLGSGLHYEGLVPLAWEPAPAGLDPLSLQGDNAEVLRFITAIDEFAKPAHGEDADRQGELARIEGKLDILLELVAQALREQAQLPEAVPVRLSTAAIEWRAVQAPSVNSPILLSLYLHTSYPRPIRLLANVQDVEPVGQSHRIDAHFQDMDETLSDWLTKLIFRYHRRSIAQHRRG